MYGVLALLLIWGEARPETGQAMIEGIGKREPGRQD